MEQEDIVQHYVDLFVKQIDANATNEEGEEMVKWYNFTTFDIIGDLAFGDPFGSLNDGLFTLLWVGCTWLTDAAKPHFWVSLILQSMVMFPWVTVFKRFPIMKVLKGFFVSKESIAARSTHLGYSRDKIMRFPPPPPSDPP